jgi:hypothetical protein
MAHASVDNWSAEHGCGAIAVQCFRLLWVGRALCAWYTARLQRAWPLGEGAPSAKGSEGKAAATQQCGTWSVLCAFGLMRSRAGRFVPVAAQARPRGWRVCAWLSTHTLLHAKMGKSLPGHGFVIPLPLPAPRSNIKCSAIATSGMDDESAGLRDAAAGTPTPHNYSCNSPLHVV